MNPNTNKQKTTKLPLISCKNGTRVNGVGRGRVSLTTSEHRISTMCPQADDKKCYKQILSSG